MSNLFLCTGCQRYLNSKLYSKECTKEHTAPDPNSCAHKCNHKRLFKNCRICNQYKCPCGRTVANNKYTIYGHKLTDYHKRHMKDKNIDNNIT